MAPLTPGDPRILLAPSRPPRIIGIGSSIGADAIVSACNENCIGAISLSPGGWLGINYAESVGSAQNEDLRVWCVAGENDQRAASACRNASGEGYQSTLYEGSLHGTDLFEAEGELVNPLGQLIYNLVMQLDT
jgi:hypothetical protein